MFREKPSWYRSIRDSAEQFGIPESVQMAIFHQESRFRARARPPRRKFLWVLPGRRPSTAFGYSQALDSTWKEYQERTDRPKARRHRFDDASHFMGWYLREIHRITGIARNDAYNLYLAYHDGPSGFRRGTHLKKAWLLEVAGRVDRRAAIYQGQFDACRDELDRFRWQRLLWVGLLALLVFAWLRFKGR